MNSGTTSNTYVNSGGSQLISEGGTAHHTVISEGGFQGIYSGGVASNAVLHSGGSQYIYDGGNAWYTSIFIGGIQSTFGTGEAHENVIMSGGIEYVESNGQAYNTEINDGGLQVVRYEGITYDVQVNSGGTQEVYSNGITNSTVVNEGGVQSVYDNGSAIGTVVNSSGTQYVSNGGVANSTTINNSGAQYVSSDGTANNTIINSFGFQYVYDGGVANDTTINNGYQYVYDSSIANGTTLNGGSQYIYSGAVASNTVINDNYAIQYIFGSAIGTTINSGGTQHVSSGVVNNTIINTSGQQHIYPNGIANSTIINSAGYQYIYTGGVANSTTIIGGYQDIFSGGVVNDTTMNSGAIQAVLDSGIANNTVVNSSIQNIANGGVANDTTINNGGTQNISSGGVANSTTVNSGGKQYLYTGGTANDTIVTSDGTQIINSGATANNTTLTAGLIELYNGAQVSGLNANQGAINVYGRNTIQGDVSLTGTNVNIMPRTGIANLIIDNLVADNATFNMNVDLENQLADELSIRNSYEGNATLSINNVAATANETEIDGLRLVEFNDVAAVNGTFELAGGQWDEGAYVYKLRQGTSQGEGLDYYLYSTGALTETFRTMLNIPVMNVVMAQTGMNSLQRRLGDLVEMDGKGEHNGVWIRTYYKDMKVNDLIKTDMNLFGAEAGYDWLINADDPTKIYAGVLLGFVKATDIKTQKDNGSYDKGKGDAPGIGIYATLVNENNWFIDLAARNFWTRTDMTNHASDGTLLKYEPKRNVFAASAELGQNIKKELDRDSYIRLEPKVELGLMRAAGSEADVSNGNKLKYKAANYANVKAGVLLSYNTHLENGMLIEPLMELAYRYELLGKDKVTYNGVTEKSNLSGGTLEFNAGLNMQLADNLYWYGVGSYEKNGKVTGWGLHAGIRYNIGAAPKETTNQNKYSQRQQWHPFGGEIQPVVPTRNPQQLKKQEQNQKKTKRAEWNPLGDEADTIVPSNNSRGVIMPGDYTQDQHVPSYIMQQYAGETASAYQTVPMYGPARSAEEGSAQQKIKSKTKRRQSKGNTKNQCNVKKKNVKPKKYMMVNGVPIKEDCLLKSK